LRASVSFFVSKSLSVARGTGSGRRPPPRGSHGILCCAAGGEAAAGRAVRRRAAAGRPRGTAGWRGWRARRQRIDAHAAGRCVGGEARGWVRPRRCRQPRGGGGAPQGPRPGESSGRRGNHIQLFHVLSHISVGMNLLRKCGPARTSQDRGRTARRQQHRSNPRLPLRQSGVHRRACCRGPSWRSGAAVRRGPLPSPRAAPGCLRSSVGTTGGAL